MQVTQTKTTGAQKRDPWHIMPAEITGMSNEIRSVRTYTMRLTDADDAVNYHARAGQFNMVYVPGVGEAAISISGDSTESASIVHTIRSVGNVTHALELMNTGATIGLRGPFGSCWPMEACLGRQLILVAGGIGLAPLRPMIYDIIHRRQAFGKVTLLMGARRPIDLLYADEYARWVEQDIEVITTVDRAAADWSGNIGVVTPLLETMAIDQPDRAMLMTCGPEIMMRFAVKTATKRGIPIENQWVSLERNMKCAIGHCGHCQLGPHFICKDGPVLRYDRVSNLIKVQGL